MQAGDQLQGYQLTREIANDGISQTFLANDSRLGVSVLIELIESDDSNLIQNYRRAAVGQARLQHTSIVPVYNVIQTGRQLAVVRPARRGDSLVQIVESQGRLSWMQAVSFIRPVLQALAYVHDQGAAHRDILPSDILVDPRENVQLKLGLPISLRAATPAQDQNAMGLVMYRMLTARRAEEPYPFPPDVPPALQNVVLKAMSDKPEDRFPSLQALDAALGSIVDGLLVPIPGTQTTSASAATMDLEWNQFGSVSDGTPFLIEGFWTEITRRTEAKIKSAALLAFGVMAAATIVFAAWSWVTKLLS